MTKYNKISAEQITLLEECIAEGMTNTATAEVVFGRSTMESSVRRYKKNRKELDEEVESLDEQELSDDQLETLCENSDWNLANLAKRLRTAQRTNNQLRKIQRDMFDGKSDDPTDLVDMLDVLEKSLLQGMPKLDISTPTSLATEDKIVEILFSDLQIGKKSESWDTPTAIRTLKYYGLEVLKIIERVKPSKIVFASLGDITEDHLKHGVQSAISTDTGLAEQMANAIEQIWWSVLSPIIATGIPLHFVGIQGNHGSSEHKGMDMYKAGRYGYDYPLYATWRTMCKVVGADHVTFDIPEGHFTTYEIFGKVTLAEHGYGHNCTEAGLLKHRDKRANNLKMYIDRYVCGDMHHECMYDNGNLVVNGAFFGVAYDAIEYSGILGFHAVPCQSVMVHSPTTGVGQSTVVEKLTIQTAKGYNFGNPLKE